MKKKPYTEDDLLYAFDQAIEFLNLEEWPEDDGGAQVAAYKEAARQIEMLIKRRIKKQIRKEFQEKLNNIKSNIDLHKKTAN